MGGLSLTTHIHLFYKKITAFTQDAINMTAGEEVKSMPYINIFPGLRKHFALWMSDIDSIGDTCE